MDEANARAAVQRQVQQLRSPLVVASIPGAAGGLFPEAVAMVGVGESAFRVTLLERAGVDALALLAGHDVEFAVVRDPVGDGFDLEPIMSEALVLASAASMPLAPGTPKEILASLAAEPFVTFERAQGRPLFKAALAICAGVGFVPRVVVEGPEIGTLGQFVERGLGVAIVPRVAFRLWGPRAIRLTELPDPKPMSTTYIATIPGRPLSPEANRMIRALRRVGVRYDETARPGALEALSDQAVM